MAKQTLPTNFKDDVLNTSMSGKRKWNISQNSDGTYSITDVTTYDQVGSEFGAGELNATNQAVNASADAGKIIDDPDTAEATTEEGYIAGVQLFNHVNDSLGGLSFGYDEATQKYGYYVTDSEGADAFSPFKSGGISEFTFNSTSSFSAEIGAKYDIICATAYNQNAKSKLQGATIINEYCEYNLSNAGYLYCAEIEATQNVVSFANVSSIGLGYLKK